MSDLVRFSVSIPKTLSDKFDKILETRGYENRSEAFRDIVRKEMVKEEWKGDETVCGTITMVYDHHQRNLLSKITDLQHEYGHLIASTMHVHVDHDNCLEVIMLKGKSSEISKFADMLVGTKGVAVGELVRVSTGKKLK